MKAIATLPKRCNAHDQKLIDVPWDNTEHEPRRSPGALKKDKIQRGKKEVIADILLLLKKRIKGLPNGPDDKYNNRECTRSCIFCRRKSCRLMG
jgi:hypothetical protein